MTMLKLAKRCRRRGCRKVLSRHIRRDHVFCKTHETS